MAKNAQSSTGWQTVATAITDITDNIRAAAPDSDTAVEGEAYVARVFTGCLNDALLGHLQGEDGFSRTLPTRGAANPDYLMRHGAVDPRKHYRIEGNLKNSERIGIGLYRRNAGGGVDLADYIVVDSKSVNSDGSFSINLGPEPGGPSALQLQADTPILLVRILHRDLDGEPARVRLMGAPPIDDLSLAGANIDGALTRALHITQNAIGQFLQWSAIASASPNRFSADTDDLTQGLQGDPDTQYFLGYYALAENEFLQVEMPRDLNGYWSVHAYNHWGEYLPGASAHDRNSTAQTDGGIVLEIGPALPTDAGNPIDTRGRRRGILVCRLIGSTLAEAPTTRLRAL